MTDGLSLTRTPIPGLLVLRLPVHTDSRGWFKENWQREKMVALGLPDFEPVQHNISANTRRGATRGVHAEPWDKLISVVTGRVFAAWVDLRAGDSFGATYELEVDPSVAVFVPRGVGNSYQALQDETTYSYLVNDHWRAGHAYPAVHLGDETAAIGWPIPLAEAEISEKDRHNPRLAEVTPMPPRRMLITGGDGQLGRALGAEFPDAHRVGRAELDIADPDQVAAWPWQDYDTVLNAAAYTAVDLAETPAGRRAAWAANATGPAALAAAAARHRLTLVHYSSDYVFDGQTRRHTEDEPLSPLGVYGQSKAAGDLAVASTPRHYLLRASWVVGDGANFVRTMCDLADRGARPVVVDDQHGRLTFTADLARATRHLLEAPAAFGTYNCTSTGPERSWFEVARRVFELRGADPSALTPISTEAYTAGRDSAPRPRFSTLDLTRLRATGFTPRDGDQALADYVAALADR